MHTGRPWLMIKTIMLFLQEAFLLNTQGIHKETQILPDLVIIYMEKYLERGRNINLYNNLSESIRCEVCGILQKTGSSFLLLLIMPATQNKADIIKDTFLYANSLNVSTTN